MISEQAIIKGRITTGTLICGGRIRGNVTATEKVRLIKPAILIGDVHAPSFSMEEGVHFHGECDMGPPEWAEETGQAHEDLHGNVLDLAVHRGKLSAQESQP